MKSKMKKLIISLTMIAMLMTAFAGCSQSGDTTENKTGEAKLVNDNPITTYSEELAPILEYFNQYVYTSDFERNREHTNRTDYWVYEPNPERPKVELSDEMKIDDTLTVKLGDDLTEFAKTEYFNYKEYNRNVDAVYCKKVQYGPDYFSLYLNPTEDKDTELQYRTIEHIIMDSSAEYDYLGITTGDTLEKVIQTIGSPNKEIRFERRGDPKTWNAYMYYTDSDKKLTLMVNIDLDFTKEEDPATVYVLSLYDYDLEEYDTDH